MMDNITYSKQVDGKVLYYLEDGDLINILDEIIRTGEFKTLESEENDGTTS